MAVSYDPKKDSVFIKVDRSKDRKAIHFMLEQDIRCIMAEIVRLSTMPYSCAKNLGKIRTLDQQVEYLEQVLAAYEADQKKAE